MLRTAALWTCLVMASGGVASAQQTQGVGTVAGTVVDRESGQPLKFANVVILGTQWGANARDAGAVGLSGKDGKLLRAEKGVLTSGGRDLGQVGHVVEVNKDFLEMFLKGGYVPVISPIGLADDGASLSINADEVAAAIAVALGAHTPGRD